MYENKKTIEDIIILHLYRNRIHLEDRRLPFAVCREGIGKTEGISIAQVSTGVRNLECSGMIFFEKRYVETKRGPCNAYSLTPMGVLRAKIIELSNPKCATRMRSMADRLKDMALLRRRDLALRTKSVEEKVKDRSGTKKK